MCACVGYILRRTVIFLCICPLINPLVRFEDEREEEPEVTGVGRRCDAGLPNLLGEFEGLHYLTVLH